LKERCFEFFSRFLDVLVLVFLLFRFVVVIRVLICPEFPSVGVLVCVCCLIVVVDRVSGFLLVGILYNF